MALQAPAQCSVDWEPAEWTGSMSLGTQSSKRSPILFISTTDESIKNFKEFSESKIAVVTQTVVILVTLCHLSGIYKGFDFSVKLLFFKIHWCTDS